MSPDRFRFEFDPTPPPDVTVRKFCRDAWLVRGEVKVEMPFVWIPPCPGGFWMGERHDAGTLVKEDWKFREEPLHKVRIPLGFWMAKTPTTQRQWEVVMQGNPSNGDHQSQRDSARLPVERVNLHQSLQFCKALTPELSLPSEAMWEYACRAGSGTEYWSGDGAESLAEVGWCLVNSGRETRPVGGKPENIFGMQDVHGNVWEWCADAFDQYRYAKTAQGWPERPRTLESGEERRFVILCGGSWIDLPESCRSALRDVRSTEAQYNNYGFRCVLFPSGFSHKNPG